MSAPLFQAVRGMNDILPDEHLYFSFIKKVVRHRCRQAGFRRITTPVMENVELFQRGLGDATDIVEKEMFVFTSNSGKRMALRPEGTAGVVRSYLQNGMQQLPQPVELYYIEPFFRYSRPQKGRFRQFHQFGFEVIGENDPALDAQVIYLAHRINQDLGVADKLQLQINTIGCKECRGAYREALVNYYIGKERSLCGDCKNRLNRNPLRLLDCKVEDCRILASIAPKFENSICDKCKAFHALVLEYLDAFQIPYVKNPQLVRGLDYYTNTVFEFWSRKEGAQNATGGGGRYDGLVELMGGQPTPGVGYAAGIERTIEYMKESGIRAPSKDKVHVFVAQLGLPAKKRAMTLIPKLRELGIYTLGAIGKASMKAQMGLADKFKAQYAIIMGQIEVQEEKAIIRDMTKGSQEIIPYDTVIEVLEKKLGRDKLETHRLWEE
ncbi:histidine--tRNA ligase [Candidatus Peregrinibacteria bacterium]|nr:histidine--tRNA ligase [Candidatus Peregrinibacteria bacterium]